MNLAAAAKAAVSEYFLNHGEAPANRTQAGMSANDTDTSGKYVTKVGVTNGQILVTYGNEASKQLQPGGTGETLGLVPWETPDLSVAWQCGAANDPAGTQLMGTKGGGNKASKAPGTLAGPTLQKYLPAACRP
jgi:type IV pilus assembly protein PilA